MTVAACGSRPLVWASRSRTRASSLPGRAATPEGAQVTHRPGRRGRPGPSATSDRTASAVTVRLRPEARTALRRPGRRRVATSANPPVQLSTVSPRDGDRGEQSRLAQRLPWRQRAARRASAASESVETWCGRRARPPLSAPPPLTGDPRHGDAAAGLRGDPGGAHRGRGDAVRRLRPRRPPARPTAAGRALTTRAAISYGETRRRAARPRGHRGRRRCRPASLTELSRR